MSIMFTQSSAIVDSMVVSLPNAPALDAAQRIVEKRKADLVRHLILAAIFGSGEGVSLEDLENYLAFCGGWARYVVHRSLRDMASRSAATTVPAFPQSNEIAPVPQNAIVVKKLAIAASKPRTPAPSVEDIASIFNACIPALDGLWFDGLLVLSCGLQADVPSMALSTIVPREAHGNIDLVLLLASMASSYTASSPLLVDLGSETSIVSVASDDDDGDVNTPATVSPAEAPNKVLAVFAKPQVPIFSAQDIIAILGDLDIYVSVPKGSWFDIPISLRSLQVDVAMYPSKVPQLAGHLDVSLILSLAAKATCCGSSPLLVDVGPSSASIVEVALDDVEVWADPNQTLVEEVPEVIFSPQNVLVKKFSAMAAKPQVSTFNARDIVSTLDDLHTRTPTSKRIWLDLPGLPHGIRLDIPPLALSATSQLGGHVNVDPVLLLASMVTSHASSFSRLVDADTSSIIEAISEGEASVDTDRTLIEDTCIPLTKKDLVVSPTRTLNPNAAIFVPPSTRLPPSGSAQELVDPPKTVESEAPAPLSRRARARRLAAARKKRAQLSEIHAAPLTAPSTPAPACPPVYASLYDAPPAPLVHHTIGTVPAPPAGHPFLAQPMHAPMPQSHYYPPSPCAPSPPVYYGPGYRHPSRMPAPRPPRQMYLDAHRYLPPAFVPGNGPMGQIF